MNKFRGKKEEKARKNVLAKLSQEEFSDDDDDVDDDVNDDVNDTYARNKKQKETESLLPIRERTVCRSNALSSATNGKKRTLKEDEQNGQLLKKSLGLGVGIFSVCLCTRARF